jgi:hypothetical protein
MHNYDERVKTFTDRLGPGGSDELIRDIATAFGIPARARDKIAAIKRDNTLSAAGQKAKIVELLNNGPIAHLPQLRNGVTKRLEEIHAECESFMPKPDRSDIFAEMQRADQRFSDTPEAVEHSDTRLRLG